MAPDQPTPRHVCCTSFTRFGLVKSGNEKWQGAKTDPWEKTRLTATCCAGEPCECRGHWIRTSDVLNAIYGFEAAPSRRMSQMQAFWRLTDFTLRTVCADHSRESTNWPHFPGFSVPKCAQHRPHEAAINHFGVGRGLSGSPPSCLSEGQSGGSRPSTARLARPWMKGASKRCEVA